MIKVSVSPTELVRGCATDVDVMLTNTAPTACSNIVFKILFPPEIRLLRGSERIQLPRISAGASISSRVRVRADAVGRWRIGTANFSYRDSHDTSIRVSNLAIEVTVDPGTADRELPVAGPSAGEPQLRPSSNEASHTLRDFDVFLCHSSADMDLVRDVARTFVSRGISYWLDEEQITFGDRVAQKIEDGLQRSHYVVPCVSANLAASNWTRAEYNAILNAEFSGETIRIVIPLVLDESDAENVPLLLRDKKRAFYANKAEFEHFLQFLLQNSAS